MFSFRLLNKIINFQKIVRLCVNEVVLFCQTVLILLMSV